MTTTVKAFALTAALSLLGATAVSAMEMEFNMLTGAVYNALKAEGFETDNIEQLSLAEIAEIKSLLEADNMGGSARTRIEQLLSE